MDLVIIINMSVIIHYLSYFTEKENNHSWADHDVGCVTKDSLRSAKSSDLIEVMARQTKISG
jgi:hypothetical protein